jgi:hypothetical protein
MVRDHDVHRIAAEQLHGLVCAGCAQDGITGMFQDELAEVETGFFIVHGEN